MLLIRSASKHVSSSDATAVTRSSKLLNALVYCARLIAILFALLVSMNVVVDVRFGAALPRLIATAALGRGEALKRDSSSFSCFSETSALTFEVQSEFLSFSSLLIAFQ